MAIKHNKICAFQGIGGYCADVSERTVFPIWHRATNARTRQPHQEQPRGPSSHGNAQGATRDQSNGAAEQLWGPCRQYFFAPRWSETCDDDATMGTTTGRDQSRNGNASGPTARWDNLTAGSPTGYTLGTTTNGRIHAKILRNTAGFNILVIYSVFLYCNRVKHRFAIFSVIYVIKYIFVIYFIELAMDT